MAPRGPQTVVLGHLFGGSRGGEVRVAPAIEPSGAAAHNSGEVRVEFGGRRPTVDFEALLKQYEWTAVSKICLSNQ